MLWREMILKSSFLKAVLMILLFHTAFRAKVTRNTLKTRRTACIRRNTAARSLVITAVENQTFLLFWIGGKNCRPKAITSILFPSSTKKEILHHPSSKMTKSFCLILAKFVFLDRFSCKSLVPLYTKIHLWGKQWYMANDRRIWRM
jgi:hypothetical protein